MPTRSWTTERMNIKHFLARVWPVERRKRAFLLSGAACVAVAGGLAAVTVLEVRHSRLQAQYFSEIARGSQWEVQPGPSPEFRLPESGPYDVRLGYAQMKDLLPRLNAAGYDVAAQARQSEGFRSIIDRGFYPIYREKAQAGLTLLDRNGMPLYASRHPERQYASFEAIPPVLVDALLFVENRNLLDPERPARNPAVDWGRLTRVVFGHALRVFDVEGDRAGGSTLATQIEKFRHTPDGLTHDVADKLKQMVSASLRAYQDGEDTLPARRRIVLDYLNSVPLAGVAGHGEVIGLGNGLRFWYGRDFAAANRLLTDAGADPAARARVFKEALSLIVAQRRPSELLLESTDRLNSLTDSYLRLLADAGVIPAAWRDDALRVRVAPGQSARQREAVSFVARKAVNDIRGTLGDLLGIDDLYALDRFDLEARTTLDAAAQAKVTAYFGRLVDRAYLACAGFREHRLLDRGDPSGVNYSFTLYEKTLLGNVLRVQADNLDQPLDINAGTKLDLGSSAKLRTLISYLSVIADLHRRYAGLDADALAEVATLPGDNLSRWAIDYLRDNEDRSLTPMLEAAMERRYSADPQETFFTGGGVARFANFKHEHDGLNPSVAEALEQSINLAFVRIMRDVVHYHAYEAADAPARSLREGDEQARELAREDFLNRFAEREGIGYLRTFWHKYHDVPPAQRLDVLAESVPARQAPLAAAYLSVRPESDFAGFTAFMRDHLGDHAGTEAGLRRLFDSHATRHFNLSDQGYLARVHPLELWLVRYLRDHPDADMPEVAAASVAARREAGRWLFADRFRHAQQMRIDIIVEVTAFERIAAEWRRLGYPFEHLVPSLATAIGSSADRPAALAALMGILVSDGMRRPTVRIDGLRFGAGTPFETVLVRRGEAPERVLPAEIAEVARGALLRVVEHGTAARVRGVFRDGHDQPIATGGKTGTGDHRFQIVAADGTVTASRVMNRAATFAFFIGDRFYGVVTAFVPGGKAARYDFTSALPVQILKELRPVLLPLIADKEGTAGRCTDARRAGRAAGKAAPVEPRDAGRVGSSS